MTALSINFACYLFLSFSLKHQVQHDASSFCSFLFFLSEKKLSVPSAHAYFTHCFKCFFYRHLSNWQKKLTLLRCHRAQQRALSHMSKIVISSTTLTLVDYLQHKIHTKKERYTIYVTHCYRIYRVVFAEKVSTLNSPKHLCRTNYNAKENEYKCE